MCRWPSPVAPASAGDRAMLACQDGADGPACRAAQRSSLRARGGLQLVEQVEGLARAEAVEIGALQPLQGGALDRREQGELDRRGAAGGLDGAHRGALALGEADVELLE